MKNGIGLDGRIKTFPAIEHWNLYVKVIFGQKAYRFFSCVTFYTEYYS